MSTSSIEALASAWARIAEEATLPSDYEGTATPAAHRASEAIQAQIRDHIVATNDMRLFGLLHLLGQSSLRMEQTLWPEDFERMTREVEEALREAAGQRCSAQGCGQEPRRVRSYALPLGASILTCLKISRGWAYNLKWGIHFPKR